jgi:two-component system OmpR family response regulator
MRILIVEDELKMAQLLRRGLVRHGHVVDVVTTGEAAIAHAVAVDYEAIVLDVVLPGMDGLATCRSMRDDGVWSPVLMLTARDGVFDRVAGLDAGADDYLVKPFAFAELLARLRALRRRSHPERPAMLEAGGLRLDPAARRVTRGDVEVSLSATEFALLETFMRRAGDVLARTDLLDCGWDVAFDSRSNVVDVYVRRLRQKIDRPFATDSIETLRGIGYRFRRGDPP